MKGETQSSHLEKMMQKQKCYPEYDLVLDSFTMKKKSLKKLESGDILLLGFGGLALYFADKGGICAKVKIESHSGTAKVRIDKIIETTTSTYDSKKYEEVVCSLGCLQCRKLEVGHKVELNVLELQYVELFLFNEKLAGKKLADAKLISVDDEIAIEITEVNHNG